MSDLFKKAISLGLGLTIVSKEKVEKAVEDLVKRGELAPSESKDLVNRLVERGEEEQSHLKDFISEQVKRVLQDMGVATTQDILTLQLRIAELERQIAEQKQQTSEQQSKL